MSEQKVRRSVEQRIVIKFLVGENVPSAEIHHRLQQQYGEECLRSFANKEMLYRHSPMKLAIKEVQGNQKRLQLNGTHQTLVYTDGMNLLAENMNSEGAIQKRH